MAHAKGFGVKSTANRSTNKLTRQTWEGMPQLDLQTRTQLWQAGLLDLKLPDGVKPRSLTADEKHWLDRAAATEYISSEQQGQSAIFYTSSPPTFDLEEADWYLRPNDYWDAAPIRLQTVMNKFPAVLFQLSTSGQPPAFYPDRTPDYTAAQEAILRSIFRETVRLGWSLPQYKWFVLERFRKTTAQVTHEEVIQILEILQVMPGEAS
ncbi:hypothetical protein LEP3755_67050 (plasmid) [Leptolyngbya sp. NIES-3755]|nr:hypothetical protein LEP3755_67050 [Leptolyngbya sp. NIES-3755]